MSDGFLDPPITESEVRAILERMTHNKRHTYIKGILVELEHYGWFNVGALTHVNTECAVKAVLAWDQCGRQKGGKK